MDYRLTYNFLGCIALLGLSVSAAGQSAPNILLLIGDDIGVEQIPVFGIGSAPARTPHLDALAQRGMRFSHVWAQPICSPTRATLLTGRYGFRTGVGAATTAREARRNYPAAPEPRAEALTEADEKFADISRFFTDYDSEPSIPRTGRGLDLGETTLPASLRAAPTAYATAAFGKWHLADADNGWLAHPGRAGFEYYSVLMNNEPESYYAWWENVNGVLEERHGYTPERKVDDALAWIAGQDDAPWFVWLAFNLAHYPHHVPGVRGLDTSAVAPSDPAEAVDAMVARLDQEIGRLLSGIDTATLSNTIVIFVGDNGTTGNAIDPPFHPERAKFTLYEGGLRVPLIIAGPGVPAGESSAVLVNTTDLYATILELAGAGTSDAPPDSVSLQPYFREPAQPSLRAWAYADDFVTDQGVAGGGHTIRDARYKLVRIRSRVELYDLERDPYETRNLLLDGVNDEEQAAFNQLQEMASALHASDAGGTTGPTDR